jgi:alpha-galactosidase
LRLGEQEARLSFYKNGYQSWSETRSFSAEDRTRIPILSAMRVMQDNPRNLASPGRGRFSSDLFAVLGHRDAHCYLVVGQAAGFRQFVYIRACLSAENAAPAALELHYDFGRQVVKPGGTVQLDDVVLVAGDHPNAVQDVYFGLIREQKRPRRELPLGWCSWYFYYGKVSEQDVRENLTAALDREVSWSHFVLDDGYESAVGDWLHTNDRFPGGLASIAESIAASGLAPGLWIAPFVARSNSRLCRDHPDWVLRDRQGKPLLAGWNPTWGLEGRFYGLDTTHPAFQQQLREWVETIVNRWGFRYLKLDFVYGASLCGDAYDRSLSSAQRLSLGYQIVRETAGDDVFILGCGSPLGPAIGWVDAMRVGPDVAPYWFARYRYHLTRDPHAVCTKFAIRNVLNRCQMHRRLWINDPDCLLLRDTNTKLSPDERMSLVNAVIITGGMYLISDRLSGLGDDIWSWMAQIEPLVRHCDAGRAWPLDYMEREIPEIVLNSAGYLAVFNFADQTVHKSIDWSRYMKGLLKEETLLIDAWTGEQFVASSGLLDLGLMRGHSSRLLRVQLDSAFAVAEGGQGAGG